MHRGGAPGPGLRESQRSPPWRSADRGVPGPRGVTPCPRRTHPQETRGDRSLRGPGRCDTAPGCVPSAQASLDHSFRTPGSYPRRAPRSAAKCRCWWSRAAHSNPVIYHPGCNQTLSRLEVAGGGSCPGNRGRQVRQRSRSCTSYSTCTRAPVRHPPRMTPLRMALPVSLFCAPRTSAVKERFPACTSYMASRRTIAAVPALLILQNLPREIAGDIAADKARHERKAGDPFRKGDVDGPGRVVPRFSIADTVMPGTRALHRLGPHEGHCPPRQVRSGAGSRSRPRTR